MLAYIRLIINPKDDEALKRVINYPTRGIGDTTIGRIAELAQQRGQSMWEAIDALVAEAATLGDAVQKTIARKVTEFVNLIRSLQDVRREKGLYDFGLEVASRSGVLAAYRAENTPEAASAIDNIEELLNSMQLFNEQCEAEIRAGEREEENKATIEEWLQNIMLLTDMDNKEDEEGNDKVTLMTVHSAKGLEYKYIYIVGCEEGLFPSERAMESPDGLEEERRLFYVALTRAKAEATLSYCEMRFKWGNMEFSSPSRFLQEIDSRYVDCEEDLSRVQRRNMGDNDDEDGGLMGRMGNFSRGGYGRGGHTGGYGSNAPRTQNSNAQRNTGGNSAIDALRERFDYRFQQKRTQQGSANTNMGAKPAPDPRIVRQPSAPRSTEGMRRIVSSPARGGTSPLAPCPYEVGNRVEHPKFGVGQIIRIEQMAEDYKVVVDFGQYGEKTLLAKFAKLTKL